MARLWKVFHGEPFMVNPSLGILGVNPRKGKGRLSSMAKHYGKAHMAWVRSFRKRGGHRSKAHNPRKYHSRARKHNPRRKHHYMRNPSIMGFQLPAIQSVLYVGAGLLGTPVAEGFITGFLPAAITGSTIGKYAVKIGTVLGLTFLVKSIFGNEKAKMVGIGGGVYVAVSAFKDFAPASIKAYIPGMSWYPVSGMSAYPVAGPTLSAYGGQPSLRNYGAPALNGYAPGIGRNFTGMGAPTWGAQNSSGAAPAGGMNVVAARFRRFQ